MSVCEQLEESIIVIRNWVTRFIIILKSMAEIRIYLETIVPTLPALAPPVTMQRFPTSNLMMSCTLLVARSSCTLSCT